MSFWNRKTTRGVGTSRRLKLESLEGRLLLSAGDLDPTFGIDGKVLTDIGTIELSGDRAYAVQADGNIVVAGHSLDRATPGEDWALARYKTDGSLDTTFGTGGKVITDFGGYRESVLGLAVDSGGKIVAIGTTMSGSVVARYNVDGSLDNTFDSDGWVTMEFGDTTVYATAVAIDSSGEIVVVGTYRDGTDGDFAVVRYNTDGSLDTTFGAGGVVATDFGGNTSDGARAVAIDNSGKIVVAGSSEQNADDADFAVARYNTDGSLDATFGVGGLTTTDFGKNLDDGARSVAIDSNGKIVVAGTARPIAFHTDFAVARYNSDGSLDASFDGDGLVTMDLDQHDHVGGVVIDDGDKIVIAGSARPGSPTNYDFFVARYNTDGSLDTSFDSDGLVTTHFEGSESDRGNAVAIDGSGKIVVAGYSSYLSRWDFSLARYNTDGSLDTGFDGDGLVTTNFGGTLIPSDDLGAETAIDSAGRIVVAGYSEQTHTGADFAVARYNPDGSLDATFGSGGLVTTDFGGKVADIGRAVAIDRNDKIVVVGHSDQDASGYGLDFALARYNTDGSLDTTFGTGGLVSTDLGGFDLAVDVAIDSGGKIVLAGYSDQGTTGYDFTLARYNADGSLDTTFDLDGRVTTDLGGNTDDVGWGVAIDSSDKIVVAGYSKQGAGGADFALARYNVDGSLDSSFDSDGWVTTDFDGEHDSARAVEIDSAGRIVVIGSSKQGAGGSDGDFALARYNPDGSLDTTFGVGGLVTTDFGSDLDGGSAVAIDGNDKIVVAGLSAPGYDWDFALARYNTDGTLDTLFGTDGLVTTDFGSDYESARSVAIDSNDTIVVAGMSRQEVTGYDFALARYENPDVVPVEIDIKPDGSDDPVNLASNGMIAVALLTTEDFDTSQADASTVVFADAVAVQSALQDIDGDGDLDMVLHFKVADTNLADVYAQLLADDLDGDGILDSNHQTAAVSLTGQTATDEYFAGFDDMDLFLSGKNLRDLLEDLASAGVI